jgi:hypothetical protein
VLVVCVLHATVLLLETQMHECTKKSANHVILGIAGKVVSRQTNLSHLIKVNL